MSVLELRRASALAAYAPIATSPVPAAKSPELKPTTMLHISAVMGVDVGMDGAAVASTIAKRAETECTDASARRIATNEKRRDATRMQSADDGRGTGNETRELVKRG